MMILHDFFTELQQIQLFNNSIGNSPVDNFELYNDYLHDRLDFIKQYQRILRGLDLLTDDQYLLLYDYFSGKIQSGTNIKRDKLLDKLIYNIENAI